MKVLVTGVSTRAIAESAARAGFAVTALDAFGDLDQHPSVRAWSAPRDFGKAATAHALAAAARTIEADAAVYLSPFENHPRLVTALARGRALWGNPAHVLDRVRDPFLVTEALTRRGFATPAVFPGDPGTPSDLMVKPFASGGGRRIRTWRHGLRLPRGCYLQERIPGVPGSVSFVAAGGRAVPLAVSRQLVGDRAFGAGGYTYCGSILVEGSSRVPAGDGLVERAAALARAVAAEFDLVGVNGVDFIVREGHPLPIEVNPRWSSSVELIERVVDISVFGAHAAACSSGALPSADLVWRHGFGAVGKAIVYAREDVTMGDTRSWLDDPGVRDVPHQGERIAAGGPICTVFALAADADACYKALVDRAAGIHAEVARGRSRSLPASRF